MRWKKLYRWVRQVTDKPGRDFCPTCWAARRLRKGRNDYSDFCHECGYQYNAKAKRREIGPPLLDDKMPEHFVLMAFVTHDYGSYADPVEKGGIITHSIGGMYAHIFAYERPRYAVISVLKEPYSHEFHRIEQDVSSEDLLRLAIEWVRAFHETWRPVINRMRHAYEIGHQDGKEVLAALEIIRRRPPGNEFTLRGMNLIRGKDPQKPAPWEKP